MTEFLFAIIGGLAAHQTDNFIQVFRQPWGAFCRYVIGVLTIMFFFSVTMRRLNAGAWRDGMLAYLMAAVGVGAGVVVGHFADALEVKR